MNKRSRTYHHLSESERFVLYEMRKAKKTFREIAERLGRGKNAAGSLCREMQRNKPVSPIKEQELKEPASQAMYAEKKARRRRKIPRKNYKLASDEELRNFVEEQLRNDEASPRDISYRVKRELADKSISPATIYRHTKRNRGLIQKLRRKGKARKQQVTKRKRLQPLRRRQRSIHERSTVVANRSEFGHWELDTVVSRQGGSGYAILTFRELKSRKRHYSLLANLKAETTLALARGFFSQLPPHMRRTLTVDNGSENARLAELEEVFSHFRVYFCDPHAPWQRGSVEQANGELRQYFPKGTDFKDVSSSELSEVELKLNRRCMDCLNGRPAYEVFDEALVNPPRIVLAGAEVLHTQAHLLAATNIRFDESLGLYTPSLNLSG